MGYGLLPVRSVFDHCYSRLVVTINENHELDRNLSSCTPYRTSNRYDLIDAGTVLPVTVRLIIFGGK
ncbi:hypothetical protein LINGRAHAP2_LOCUS13137 [Linum grandiflorum]